LTGVETTSASVFWTSLTYEGGDITKCTRVFLRSPDATDLTLKAFDDPSNPPYDVLSFYQGGNGGPGQYSLGLEERQTGGCRNTASLSGGSMTVTGTTSTGDWTSNAQVSLFDGVTDHVLKPFGVADASPYDVTSIYDGAGPGSYEIRLTESGGGGTARITAGSMSVYDEQCEQGCEGFAAAPPVADGVTGAVMTVDRGAGPDDLIFDIDAVTCSDDHAVVLYGNLGDFTGYAGAVDVGCDIGDGQSAVVTHVGDNVWFNVIWVNADDAGGHPGYATGGARDWLASSPLPLCGVTSDNQSKGVCN
jgi:hypothetical protein